jgi:hypothetical protein
MILKKYENIKFSEGNPSWQDLYSIFKQNALKIMNNEAIKGDILYYIEWGEDFCMNVKPNPTIKRTENHMIMTTDAIGFVLFHNLGKVCLLRDAIYNIFEHWGFPRPKNIVTPGHDDLQLNGGKVFGSQVGVNGLMAWESGAIYLDWDDAKYETNTTEGHWLNKLSAEQRAGSSGKITGLIPEGKRIGVSFNVDDFEELFLKEIERLLAETEPIPFNMFEEVK